MVNANPITCLSTREHNNRVSDIALHYFGCLEVRDQEKYFASLSSVSQEQIRDEERRVAHLRAACETRPRSYQGKLLKDFKRNAYEWHRYKPKYEPSRGSPWPLKHGPEERLEEDLQASLFYFTDGQPCKRPGIEGVKDQFSHQNVSVDDLLTESQDNPIMWPCPENTIRYFHLPANNMGWIEEIMARYYHEERPELDDFVFDSSYQTRTRTQTLLRPKFWRAQSAGTEQNSKVHARHMRPLCEIINTNQKSMEPTGKNLVLYMHYLHWETDRARIKCSDTMKNATENPSSTLAEVVEQAAAQEQIDQSVRHSLHNSSSPSGLDNDIPMARMISPTRVRRRKALAQLLLLASSLYETMTSHTNRKLILEYLHNDPPLHPRRTLDQSYYGALKSTHARDRDQVVYRYTSPATHECRRQPQGKACQDCMTDIQKVPRVIMVDQLWMWILDGETIITSFPRRWGKNHHDPSDVNKRLQARLREISEDEIKSVYDLALIITDECSRVLFDRSRIKGPQPNLVDIFSDAIQGVTYKETAAFDQFLTYTHLASTDELYEAVQNSLLNINAEGDLLKEVKDILDELHILIQIQTQQQNVAETFVRHIRHILLPKVTCAVDFKLESPIDPSPFRMRNAETRDELNYAKSTLKRADNLLRGIQERISELKSLEKAAKNTSASLKDLLSLKQQQASVIEAREAVKQAKETLKQGRSILLFTVVTIVFLPLSFFGTIFGMNSAEFNGGTLTLRQQFTYMIPISIAFILVSLLLAFGHSSVLSPLFSLISAIISYPYNICVTWFLTETGLFTFSREVRAKATRLKNKERQATAKMKAEALRTRTNWREKMDFWNRDEGDDDIRANRVIETTGDANGEELREISAGDFGRRRAWTVGGRDDVESNFGSSQRNLVSHGPS